MSDLIDKIPPQSLESEKAVLGSMLIEKNAIDTALIILSETNFYKEEHRQIFRTIRQMYEQKKAVDIVTVGETLKKLDVLADLGGAQYLQSLIDTVTTAANIEDYAMEVRNKAILRELISTATAIVTECYHEQRAPTEILERAEQSLFNLRREEKRQGFVSLSSLSHEVLANIETFVKRKGQVVGVPSGFAKLDALTSGFHPGNLIIIAGRPSMGKTALCLNIAEHVALKAKLPVAIYSLEMALPEIILRMICSLAKVSLFEVRAGQVNRTTWPLLTTAMMKLHETVIELNELPSGSIVDLRAQARRLHSQKNIGLFIIDYLQLLAGGTRRNENRQQEVSEISRSLKSLARDLNVPIIAVSQLSRRPEERDRAGEPRLADLRESGALEQDADMVLFVYRESEYKREQEDLKGKAKIIIAKQRNGPTGIIELAFLDKFTRFENLAEVEK